MDTITFVVHPEWIKNETPTIYRDLCAALRVCVTHLQYQNPDWNLVLIHSDERTLTAKVALPYGVDFVGQMYQMAGDIVLLDAQSWLRVSEFSRLAEIPHLAEPSLSENTAPHSEPTAEPDHPEYLDALCRLPVTKEYPMLSDCLRSQAEMIRMLRKLGLIDCVWDQNLLVAIDDNADFNAFMTALHMVYCHEGLAAAVRAPLTPTTNAATWDLAVSKAEKLSPQPPQNNRDILLVIDIRRAGFEQGSQNIRNALQRINRLEKKFLCVFRTQVLEMDLIERMIDDINDIMPVRPVVVPPADTDTLAECFKASLNETGCTLSEHCGDLIEQWIVQESNVGKIGGQELVKRMVRELILHKAQVNIKNGLPDKTIVPEDILNCMQCGTATMPQNAREQLNSLIGVAEIKQRIPEIAAQIKVQHELANQGVEKPALHMMFTGNPGTGKTLVARIIASILREEGILSKGHLFEVNARELCGRHVGETAPKVSSKCKDAYGSVLFVDEAYMLYQHDGYRDFGTEAITTLMTEMENHRDDFCVIFAGYPEDMEHLMTANPGLRSRIPYTIHFPNYSREELTAIFFQMLEGRFAYDDSLKRAAEEFFRSIPDEVMASPDFSNARMVRNLYERVWGKAAYRKMLNKETELVLRGEDLSAAIAEHDFRRLVETPSKKRPIGFTR